MNENFELQFAKDNEATLENLGGGVSRKIMTYCNHLMLVRVFFEKGAVGAVHNHPHLQMSYVAEGSFEVTINQQTQILTKGDVFYAPTMVYHGVTCLESGELVDVFNPTREDFL